MSDPLKTRLERRRDELMMRVELLKAEAAAEGEWSEGARLALHAKHPTAQTSGGRPYIK